MLGNLFQSVLGAVTNHTNQQNQSPNTPFDPSNLISELTGLFGNHAQQTGQVLGSSQDPYGDPANQSGGVLGSSQDPYGDPADQR